MKKSVVGSGYLFVSLWRTLLNTSPVRCKVCRFSNRTVLGLRLVFTSDGVGLGIVVGVVRELMT